MEKDLFNPIKSYFEAFGYVCDGEVNDIDLYMEKSPKPGTKKVEDAAPESVAVELKQSLDFKSVQQAALRQKITDHVFIGIFKPKDLYSSSFQDKLYILKRLGIGLIVVSKRSHMVEVVSSPEVSELSAYQRHNTGKKKALSAEFQKRKTKSNVGGVKGTKLITSYREEALLVLDALINLGGGASTKDIRSNSGIKNATQIMYNNYYGWFSRSDNGRYKVEEPGYQAAEEYSETIMKMRNEQ